MKCNENQYFNFFVSGGFKQRLFRFRYLVLITFPFTDLSGSKLRPAVVLAETVLDMTVCFITTPLQWQESTDVSLLPSIGNGLKKQSLVRTSKIATLEKTLVKGLLGKLQAAEIAD